MKASKNSRAVTVGIFIIIGLAIFIVGVLALGGQRKSFVKTFTISAVFADVNGLQVGNNVWYAGVKVGTVKKIAFNHNSRVDVLMDIEEKYQPFIHKDSRAKVGSDGLIGNKIVVLYGGTETAPVIAKNDVVGVEASQSMDEMMNTLQSNNKNLLEITTDFKTISKRIVSGEGSIGKLLNDETMANSLQATLNTLNRASNNAQQLTENMASYTAKLQSKGSLANSLITDTVIFNRLRQTALKIDNLSKTANDVVDNLKTSSNQINSSINNNKTPVGVLLHDEEAAASLKSSIQNLQSGTKKLDEDLEALQHNFLLRGFFKKKEKEKIE